MESAEGTIFKEKPWKCIFRRVCPVCDGVSTTRPSSFACVWCVCQYKECLNNTLPANLSLLWIALFRKSIHLVLRLEWQSLAKVAKLHVKSQMTQCRDNFKKLSDELASKCNSILRLMEDPWGNAILKDLMQEKPYQDSAGNSLFSVIFALSFPQSVYLFFPSYWNTNNMLCYFLKIQF